jgi:hypothetical protein
VETPGSRPADGGSDAPFGQQAQRQRQTEDREDRAAARNRGSSAGPQAESEAGSDAASGNASRGASEGESGGASGSESLAEEVDRRFNRAEQAADAASKQAADGHKPGDRQADATPPRRWLVLAPRHALPALARRLETPSPGSPQSGAGLAPRGEQEASPRFDPRPGNPVAIVPSPRDLPLLDHDPLADATDTTGGDWVWIVLRTPR